MRILLNMSYSECTFIRNGPKESCEFFRGRDITVRGILENMDLNDEAYHIQEWKFIKQSLVFKNILTQ